jgi:hypothetical protein
MKYIYKGMSLPGWGDLSGSVLLGWHEKVCLFILPIHPTTSACHMLHALCTV